MTDILNAIRMAQKALCDCPPLPLFASFSLFSADNAILFEHEGRRHVGAHPTYWTKARSQDVLASTSLLLGKLPPIFGIQVVDLDTDRDAKLAFFDAMSAAMMAEPPDNLR